MRPMLLANVLRRFRVAGFLIESAGKARGNTKKSDFYRPAMIVICSIVEALVYELIRRNTTSPDHIIESTNIHSELTSIKGTTLALSHDIFLCKKNKKDLKLDDADFGKMVVFLRNRKLVTYPKYKQINWVRTERNKIHVQGLKGKDIGYTKEKTDRVGEAIDYLLGKL